MSSSNEKNPALINHTYQENVSHDFTRNAPSYANGLESKVVRTMRTDDTFLPMASIKFIAK